MKSPHHLINDPQAALLAREQQRMRRTLLGMTIALAGITTLTLSAPFWAALYICSTQGCL